MNINSTLIAQLVVFFVLAWFTMKFVWPPITKALDERAKKIADGLAAADRGKQDLLVAEKRVADEMQKVRQQASEIIQAAEKRAGQIVDEARDVASQEGARLLAEAKVEIQQETLRAKEVLRTQLAELVVDGAEKILRREIDSSKHADLLANIKTEF